MAIADFVLLYNKAAEALAKRNRVDFDFYTGIADTKAQWIKYCKPYETQKAVPGTPSRFSQAGVRATIRSFIDKLLDTAPFGNSPVDGLRP